MSNITREYALELAKLYGIEVNKNSNEHLVEEKNGNIIKFKIQDIPDLIGINFDDSKKWFSIIKKFFISLIKYIC